MKKEKWVDVTKGFCVISIILSYLNRKYLHSITLQYATVTLLIILGYLISDTRINKENLKNKFSLLMKPYFITGFIILLIDFLANWIILNKTDILSISKIIGVDFVKILVASSDSKVLLNIYPIESIKLIWFLPALFFAIFEVYFIFNKVKSWKFRLAISAIIGILGYTIALMVNLPFGISESMMMTPFIMIGKYIKDNEVLNKININKYFMYILFLVILVIGYFLGIGVVDLEKHYFKDIILSIIISIITSILLLKITKEIKYGRIFEIIGKNYLKVLLIFSVLLNSMEDIFINIWKKIGFDYGTKIQICTYIGCIIIILCISKLIEIYKKKIKIKNKEFKSNRDVTLDVLRAICIIIMIFGHFQIDGFLRNIIYSFHMALYIIISGYFYKKKNGLINDIFIDFKKIILPYSIFAILFLIYKHNQNFWISIKNVIGGVSYTSKIFKSFQHIGPIYFALLLTITKILFRIIDEIKGEKCKSFVVIALSLLGLYLGKKGLWLLWSFDVAMYALIFFYIGYIFKKYDVLNKISNFPYLYFIFSFIWIYMIYNFGMEIAVRIYEPYGFIIIGAVSAFLTLYGIVKIFNFSNCFKKVCTIVGSGTMYILVIHSIMILPLFKIITKFTKNNNEVGNMIITIIIQVVIGTFLSLLINFIQKNLKNTINKR